MSTEYLRWKKLFLFGLGLAMASVFCMKWMEGDLYAANEKFTILGLELFYPAKKITFIFSEIDAHVKTILRYHLVFDFAFMAGIFPGIASLCMMARANKSSRVIKNILFIAACLQLFAWGLDVFENYSLLKWIDQPQIGREISIFHLAVISKWVIALSGALFSISLLLFQKKK